MSPDGPTTTSLHPWVTTVVRALAVGIAVLALSGLPDPGGPATVEPAAVHLEPRADVGSDAVTETSARHHRAGRVARVGVVPPRRPRAGSDERTGLDVDTVTTGRHPSASPPPRGPPSPA